MENLLNENLAVRTLELLKERNYQISFAESCTGGLCASMLISVPDASHVLNESYITYSNEAKTKILNVSKNSISTYGVVSEEVAKEMAQGVANLSGSEVGVGVTGVAGPGPSSGRDGGCVCFGFYVNGELFARTVNFGDIGRNEVRESAASHVFKILNYYFENEENKA